MLGLSLYLFSGGVYHNFAFILSVWLYTGGVPLVSVCLSVLAICVHLFLCLSVIPGGVVHLSVTLSVCLSVLAVFISLSRSVAPAVN